MNWTQLNEDNDGLDYTGFLTISQLNCIIMARVQAVTGGFSADITINNKTMASKTPFSDSKAAKKWCEKETLAILEMTDREIPQIMEDLGR